MILKIIQPMMSFSAAEAMTSIPISLFSRFMSMRVFAITGRADIESAVPKKSAKTTLSPPGSRPKKPENCHATAYPNENGRTIPSALTRNAVLR